MRVRAANGQNWRWTATVKMRQERKSDRLHEHDIPARRPQKVEAGAAFVDRVGVTAPKR